MPKHKRGRHHEHAAGRPSAIELDRTRSKRGDQGEASTSVPQVSSIDDRLEDLGLAAHTRYEQSGDLKDLEDSIAFRREARVHRPVGHPLRFYYLMNLGISLSDRYQQLGKTEDSQEAITYFLDVLANIPVGHSLRHDPLHSLGAAFRDRYNHLGKFEDLEADITYSLDALSYCPISDPQRSDSLHGLGAALYERYQQLGKIEDLQEAIDYHLNALSLRPVGHPKRSISLISLGAAIGTRYQESGNIESLQEATDYFLESLSLCPIGHPQRSNSLSHLGIALSNCYHQSGNIEDLQEAITYSLEALSLCPVGDPLRSRSLYDLGTILGNRYQVLRKIEDLEATIAYLLEALSLCPIGHRRRPDSLGNLGVVLCERYLHLGKTEDLREAIRYLFEALYVCPVGHSKRSHSLTNLAIALNEHYLRFGRVEDLQQAIGYFLDALSLCPIGHTRRVDYLNNLGNALRERYHLGKTEDLEEAINYFIDGLSLCSVGHPERSKSLYCLAIAIFERYQEFDRIEDLDQTLELLQQAANQSGSNLPCQLAAAQKWASIARYHHSGSAVNAYSTFFRLLDHSLLLHIDVASQHKFLATTDISTASDAASAAIDAGQLDAAIELLEQGRAVLWAKMNGYRQPLDQLRQVDEKLADRLENISTDIERLTLSSESQTLDSDRVKRLVDSEGQIRRHRILSKEWDDVIGQVRNIDGFSHFLQAIPFATLQKAAAEGPIIIVNVSEYRSDVIILLVDGPPILVPLPGVRPQRLNDLRCQLARAQDGHPLNNPSITIFPVLRELWNGIVHPVVDRLDQLGVPEKSRIWWCPTSELCGLPIHAAGEYRRNQKNLPDRYVSSYIPTISALIRARSNSIRQSTVPKLLIIGQPDESLPYLQREIKNIRRRCRGFVDLMVGEEASRDKVLDGLQQHSWAHFACHGYLGDNAQPFKAGFQLHGDNCISLLDLAQARLPNAELAFLSACHSAAGESSTPNETINLAAAMQFCGFRSVVGTLWTMEDQVGPIISKEFYKHMFRNSKDKADFRDSAEALNVAIRALRKKQAPVEFWITFIHIGA